MYTGQDVKAFRGPNLCGHAKCCQGKVVKACSWSFSYQNVFHKERRFLLPCKQHHEQSSKQMIKKHMVHSGSKSSEPVRNSSFLLESCLRGLKMFFKKSRNQATKSRRWQHCMESSSSLPSPPNSYTHSIPK